MIIGLKTAKGTKQLKLDPTIYEALQKEHVKEGDVIYIGKKPALRNVISALKHKIIQKGGKSSNPPTPPYLPHLIVNAQT